MKKIDKVRCKKKCFKCKKVKSINSFYKNRAKKDGLSSLCKDCFLVLYFRKSKHRNLWNKNHKDSIYKAIEKYIKKYPQKYKAKKILHKALKDGIIKKENCKICGNEKSHGHHPNYNKPLEVIWLCPLHHKEIHFNRLKI